METSNNRDEFEVFLKRKVDQYRISPLNKTWKRIFNYLHPKNKWLTTGGSLLLLTGLFFIGRELANNYSNVTVKKQPIDNSRNTSKSLVNSPVLNSVQNRSTGISSSNKSVSVRKSVAQTDPASSIANFSDNNIKKRVINSSFVNSPIIKSADGGIHVDMLSISPTESNETIYTKNLTATPVADNNPVFPKEINWLQEMAAIKLTRRTKSRFDLQFYFSPTISYRRLADNKNHLNSPQLNIPLASNSFNIDRYVDHKPSIGVELGSNILFAASKNFTIKSGVQLNYTRYTIKAYKFYYEKASIALNTAGPVADTITTFTSFRNFSGYFPEDLQNQYLQVSVPIGAELKLLGNKRLQLNIAGTLQPTYLLFSDAYLLSTDYVNYAKEPSLLRKWNVNSSAEAFISYKVGGVRWQIGPQFRYQLMSSYNDRYPIKENLVEYGFKLGVSKTLR